MIDTDTLFVRAEEVVSCELEGGSALLDLSSSSYFRLNDTANFIWERLEAGPSSVNQLAESLTEAFDVTKEECIDDVAAILTDLEGAGLISRK